MHWYCFLLFRSKLQGYPLGEPISTGNLCRTCTREFPNSRFFGPETKDCFVDHDAAILSLQPMDWSRLKLVHLVLCTIVAMKRGRWLNRPTRWSKKQKNIRRRRFFGLLPAEIRLAHQILGNYSKIISPNLSLQRSHHDCCNETWAAPRKPYKV